MVIQNCTMHNKSWNCIEWMCFNFNQISLDEKICDRFNWISNNVQVQWIHNSHDNLLLCKPHRWNRNATIVHIQQLMMAFNHKNVIVAKLCYVLQIKFRIQMGKKQIVFAAKWNDCCKKDCGFLWKELLIKFDGFSNNFVSRKFQRQ